MTPKDDDTFIIQVVADTQCSEGYLHASNTLDRDKRVTSKGNDDSTWVSIHSDPGNATTF